MLRWKQIYCDSPTRTIYLDRRRRGLGGYVARWRQGGRDKIKVSANSFRWRRRVLLSEMSGRPTFSRRGLVERRRITSFGTLLPYPLPAVCFAVYLFLSVCTNVRSCVCVCVFYMISLYTCMHECVVLHVCLDLSRSVRVSAGSHNLNPRTNPFRETGFTYASYVYVVIEVAQNFFYT